MKLGYKIPDILGSKRYKIQLNALETMSQFFLKKNYRPFRPSLEAMEATKGFIFMWEVPQASLSKAPKKELQAYKFCKKNLKFFCKFLGIFFKGMWGTT